LGAEIDCWEDPDNKPETTDEDVKLENYVELKTYRLLGSDRSEMNWRRHKLLSTWIQSFTVGVRNIVFGFRDDDGIIQKIEKYSTLRIPEMTKSYWVSLVSFSE
jgi:RAT1-interacting protein